MDKKIKDYLAIIIAVAGFLFSAGGFYFQVGALQAEVTSMRQDLARKDVLEQQLRGIDLKIDAMGAKIDQVLRRP